MTAAPTDRARAAIEASGLAHRTTEHGPVASLQEAAQARGLTPDRVLKSIVVRRGEADHLFVLVPGGRTISWPKLRALLGVNRLSMPSADAATPRPVQSAGKEKAVGQWRKRCPRCQRDLPARRMVCDCGHSFQPNT